MSSHAFIQWRIKINCVLLSFLILLLTEYYWSEQIMADEVSGACCTFGEEESFTHDFREVT
jgi:hypothetical protein